MGDTTRSAVRIIDSDNDVVSVTNNRLDVNATLAAGAAIDIGDVEITGHSTIANGSNTDIDTSAEVLGASAACKEVVIQAATTNTGIVYVGASGVSTTTGIALNAGDAFSFNIDNIDNVYVIASAVNQAVSYVYFN